MIELKQPLGDTARRRQRLNASAIKPEAVSPLIPPRVEERDNRTRYRINRSEVTPLALIADDARIGKVVRLSLTTVFRGDDVVDPMRGESKLLGDEAVFTALTGSLANLSPDRDG